MLITTPNKFFRNLSMILQNFQITHVVAMEAELTCTMNCKASNL